VFANHFPTEKIVYRQEKVGSWRAVQLLLKYCSGNIFVEICCVSRSQPTSYEEIEAFFPVLRGMPGSFRVILKFKIFIYFTTLNHQNVQTCVLDIRIII